MTRIFAACWLVSLIPCAFLLGQAPAGPSVSIQLGTRQGRVVPHRQGFAHTGGGNIDVAQPGPDNLVVTMTGVAVAGAHPARDSLARLDFDLLQCFEVVFDNPAVKKAKLTLEVRGIGLLRSHGKAGTAEHASGHASITCGPVEALSLTLPPHSVSCGENVSVNDRRGPIGISVAGGEFHLHQSFSVSASHPRSLKFCKASSAEFAPDPALDPLWISYWEPFHGATKKDFGFQIIVRVTPENGGNGEKKGP